MKVEYKYMDNDMRVFEIDPVKVVRQDGNAVAVEYVEPNGETHNLLLPLMNLRFIDLIFKEDETDES